MARDYTAKVAGEAVALLPDDETVRRAVVANPSGGFLDQINQGDPRIGVMAWRAKREANRVETDGGVAAGIPRKNAYLAVTNQRFVIFDLTRMGKLKSVVAAFTPEELPELHAERRNRSTSDLHLLFEDGSTCTYAIIQKQDAEALVADFDSLR